MVNGVPEFNITVWDLESLEKMGSIELRTDLNFLSVSFSPKDTSLVAVLYYETLHFWTMEPYVKLNQESFQDYNRFSISEF